MSTNYKKNSLKNLADCPTAQKSLRDWFIDHRRPLPWRDNPSPYSTWVSEVMLQQTQASVVTPYFQRWMKEFPDIQTLALAPLDDVLKCWEGLGYYSRARNLHQGAKNLVRDHNGHFPDTVESMQKIKGLGPYTIGAILSFAFKRRSTAVDGNVIRVITRLFGIDSDVGRVATKKEIEMRAESLLTDKDPHLITEGLIELGALVCQKSPKCSRCPLSSYCVAYQTGDPMKYPVKKKGPKVTKLYRNVALIQSGSHFLVQRGQTKQIMRDLCEFPFIEGKDLSLVHFQKAIEERFSLSLELLQELEEDSHSFTRYKAFLTPYHFSTNTKVKVDGFDWIERDVLKKLPFSSGHRRIWEGLCALYT